MATQSVAVSSKPNGDDKRPRNLYQNAALFSATFWYKFLVRVSLP